MHRAGLEAMGAELGIERGFLRASAPEGLAGASFRLGYPSVGATENLMTAATTARGTTVLENVAREPEIVDLAQCLRKMGAQIDGEGTSEITIQGVDRLGGATHRVVTDRIELGTYMLAPAICGGEVTCLGGRIELVQSFCEKLDEAGIAVTETERGLTVNRKNGHIRAVNVRSAASWLSPRWRSARSMARPSRSKASSPRPFLVWAASSCRTPAMRMLVTAAPGMDDSSVRRRELPSV